KGPYHPEPIVSEALFVVAAAQGKVEPPSLLVGLGRLPRGGLSPEGALEQGDCDACDDTQDQRHGQRAAVGWGPRGHSSSAIPTVKPQSGHSAMLWGTSAPQAGQLSVPWGWARAPSSIKPSWVR